MGKISSLTDVRRAQIVILNGEGDPEKDIAAKLRCSMTAVHNAIINFSADHRTRSGRPRKTRPREDRPIRQIVTRTCYFTLKKVQQ